jgi:hypothetical protein
MAEWLKNFRQLAITAFVCFGTLGALLTVVGRDPKYSSLPFILFLCGASGAVVGNYRKLSLLGNDGEATKQALATPAVTLQLYVSPLVGGVFAMLAWAMFFSGLLKGVLFPDIANVTCTYDNFHNLMANTHPEHYADAMKGVFWAFVAGYSEKFVPNAIDQAAQKASNKQG